MIPTLRCLLAACLATCVLAAGASGPAPRLLVRVAAPGPDNGRLDVIDGGSGQRLASLAPRCDRAYQAGGTLGCLRAVPGQGVKFDLADRGGAVRASFGFPNVLLPSRVRVSADGAMAAFTGFTGGHSYTGTDFSVRTYLVDAARKRLLADLSTFRVIESAGLALPGKRINVWGVSFDPGSSQRFVATVGAAGAVFLAHGDSGARTLTLLRAEVECPSYSPDGRRIAFKRRNGAGGWLPAVLELASGRERVLDEARSVDDQIAWLDNNTIVYELSRPGAVTADEVDLVARSADGGARRVLLAHAGSPSPFD